MDFISLKLIFLFGILLPTSMCQTEEYEKFAIELTAETFDNAIKEYNHFVMFFTPWCGHSKRLFPLWEQLAEIMNVKEDAKLIIAKVDCTQQQQLCSEHDITGYPDLRFYKLGEESSVRFKGTRDIIAITEFIQQNLGNEPEYNDISSEEKIEKPHNKLIELTEENFAKHVSSGNHFVKFYAPWCSHCQRLAPTWEELSKSLQYETAAQISKIDCTVYRSICQDFDVKGYPTLLWIEDGKKIEKYSGSRNHDDLKEYVKKMLRGPAKHVEEQIAEKKNTEVDKNKVLELTGSTFKDAIHSGITFVKYYAPWCGHCQKLSPTWDQLAINLQNKMSGITIAKVDCTAAESKELCVEQQVEGYPTLLVYKNGVKVNEYDGSRSLDDLSTYIKKMVGHDEL